MWDDNLVSISVKDNLRYVLFTSLLFIFPFFFYTVLLFHIGTQNMNNILVGTFIKFSLLAPV